MKYKQRQMIALLSGAPGMGRVPPAHPDASAHIAYQYLEQMDAPDKTQEIPLCICSLFFFEWLCVWH